MRLSDLFRLSLLLIFLAALNPACKDLGDEPVDPPDTPVTAEPTSVSIAPGDQAVVQISGGTPPYRITEAPDPAVATAVLSDSTMDPATLTISAAITAIVSSMTTVSVGDVHESENDSPGRAAHGDDEVTIDVLITLITPVTASPPSVGIAPGAQAVVQISGGTPPYRITATPDPAVAAAVLTDSASSPATLTITAPLNAMVSAMTTVSVGDADTPINEGGGAAQDENEVTIDITITTPPVTVSFSAEVQPIFTANCAFSGCHGGNNPVLGLSLEAGNAYGNLVNVPAGSSDCNGEPRVLPGNSAGSVLFKRISGNACDEQMPLFGTPLTASDQTTIQTWIDEGALEN